MTTQELIRQAALPLPEEALTKLVQQIVEAVRPEKIILFGSAVRGTMGPNSDLDLLVIKSGDYHHIEVAQQIYMQLHDNQYPVDIIVNTPEEVERYKDSFCLVLYPALREGKVIYDATAA